MAEEPGLDLMERVLSEARSANFVLCRPERTFVIKTRPPGFVCVDILSTVLQDPLCQGPAVQNAAKLSVDPQGVPGSQVTLATKIRARSMTMN